MRICTYLVFAMSIVVWCGSVRSSAQPSQRWRDGNGHDKRYEGVGYDRAVVAAAPKLISFHAIADNERQPDVVRDAALEADFLAWAVGPYSLVARELQIKYQYWMEPKEMGVTRRGLNTFERIWQTDVLREIRDKGPIDKVGVLVNFGKQTDWEHVSPVVLRGAGSPKAGRILKYNARFLSDVTFDNLTFTLRKGCDRPDAPTFPDTGSVGKQYGRLSFPVEFTVPDDYAGLVAFDVSDTNGAQFEVSR